MLPRIVLGQSFTTFLMTSDVMPFRLAWCNSSILNTGISSSLICGVCQITLGCDGNNFSIWMSVSSSLGCTLGPSLNLFVTIWYALHC